jgi:hypothetical protein
MMMMMMMTRPQQAYLMLNSQNDHDAYGHDINTRHDSDCTALRPMAMVLQIYSPALCRLHQQ